MGLQWSGGPLYVAHKVLPGQFELDPKTGRVKPLQAAKHEVSLWSMNLNLVSRLGLLDWLDLRLRFPLRFVNVSAQFRDESGKELPDFTSIHHRDETLVGIADPELRVGFRPFLLTSTQRWLFEFGGGVGFPLGKTEPDPNKAGQEGREHQHIMFGSGTFDPIGFLTIGYLGATFQVFGNVFARGALYENSYGFQTGLQVRSALSVESNFGLHHWSFQLQGALLFNLPGLWSGKEDPDAASGRTDLLFTAGVYWRPTPQWQASVQISLPVNLQLVGGEINHPFILGFGLNYQFRLF